MLLRRLGLALKSHWPDDDFGPAERARPLGNLTPVATSATLGDGGDPAAMLEFARTVFGDDFDEDAVVTESRLSLDEWLGEPTTTYEPRTDREAVETAVDAGSREVSGRRIAEVVLAALFAGEGGTAPLLSGATVRGPARPGQGTPLHPDARPPQRARPPVSTSWSRPCCRRTPRTRPAACWPRRCCCSGPPPSATSARRSGREALSVDLHLWVRELSRIDRRASASPEYLWSDDRHLTAGAERRHQRGARLPRRLLPALRPLRLGRPARPGRWVRPHRCGRRRHPPRPRRRGPRVPGAAARAGRGRGRPGAAQRPRRAAADVAARRAASGAGRQARPTRPALAEGRVLPVLAHAGPEAGERSRTDTCPSCLQKDGIRFLGSAVATLMSVVALDHLRQRRPRQGREEEPRLHRQRAGRRAPRRVRAEPLPPPDPARRAARRRRRRAGQPRPAGRAGARAGRRRPAPPLPDPPARPRRPRRVRAVLAEAPAAPGAARRAAPGPQAADARRRARDRPAVAPRPHPRAHRQPGRPGRRLAPATLLRASQQVEKAVGPQQLRGPRASPTRTGCAGCAACSSGCAPTARSSTSGSAATRPRTGSRYSIWGGRPAPTAWSRSRAAGRARRTRASAAAAGHGTATWSPVASSQSWYAVWTSRVLGCSPAEGASLAVELLKQLAALEVARGRQHRVGRAGLRAPAEPGAGRAGERRGPRGRCRAARLRHLRVARCPAPGRSSTSSTARPARSCAAVGRLGRSPGDPTNFYRTLYAAADTTRVVAREHTSLLPDEVAAAVRDPVQGQRQEPAGTQRPGRHAHPGDGHRHRRPVDGDAGVAAAQRGVVPAAGRPRRPPDRQRAQPRLRLRARRAAAAARRPALGGQRPGAPAGHLPRRRGHPAPAVPRLGRRHPRAAGRRASPDHADAGHRHRRRGQLPARARHGSARPARRSTRSSARFDTLSRRRAGPAQGVGRPSGAPADQPAGGVPARAAAPLDAREVETLQHRIAEIQAELPALQERAELPAATDDDKIAVRTAAAGIGLAAGS